MAEADLSYRDTEQFLRLLGDATTRIIVIGGQALNFWAERFRGHIPSLEAEGPFTSKDIDFAGDRDAVTECALRLHGKALFPSDDDHAPPNAGKVTFHDHHHDVSHARNRFPAPAVRVDRG